MSEATPTPTPEAQPAAPAATPAAAAAPAAPASLLAQGSAAPAPTAAPAADEHYIPAKLRVTKDDGSVDVEASAKKLAEAYALAEKRIGSGDLPPKAPEEYALEGLPETVDVAALKSDPEMSGFLKAAHAKGLTNAQVSFVLNEYIARAAAAAPAAPDPQRVTAELRAEWKSEADFSGNLRNAYRAFDAYAAPGDKERMDEIGNNAVVIRLLARIGADIAEDAPIEAGSPQEQSWDSELSKLKAERDALQPQDARRKDLQARIDDMFTQRYGKGEQKLGGGRTFSTTR
jgi:hypothetical protein